MTTVNLLYPLLCTSRLCFTKIRHLRHLSIPYFYSTRYTSKHNSQASTLSNMENNCQKNIFQGKKDRFNGITIHSDKEICADMNEFPKKLDDSLDFWKENGYRGIWFRVHLDHSEWVPVLTKKGFKFHHAQDEYVMMYHWLPHAENCNIPHYAHTMLGVGAVVVNEKSQVLTVREKYTRITQPFWKLPGGYAEPGENLVDAAIREVHEETGIITEFQSIITFRHTHNGMFKCSDIYVIVSLKPLSETIQKCEREIAECKWMDIDEYMNHPGVHEHNRFFVQKYLEYNKHDIKINCFHGIHAITKKPYTMYSVTKKDLKPNGQVRDNIDQDNNE